MNQPTPDPTQVPPSGAAKPAYLPPRITVLTSEAILEQVGPALTCSILPCPTPA
jgi:hypothetical protein